MDGLTRDLVDNILFRVDLRSLAMMRCTNKTLQTHINDPYFESEYSSRLGSDLLHISTYGSSYLSYNTNGGSRSLKIKDTLTESHILGSSSGLLLLAIDNLLCVLNPLTKKFQFFTQSTFMRFFGMGRGKKKHIGFAVHQVDRTTQSFKVVHMIDTERTYKFEINAGDSWRRLETTLTCHSRLMKPPVYVDGSLHWLRNDGSIVAFNLETEQARLIPVEFPRELTSKTLFAAAGDNSITLISATDKVIYFYTLKNLLNDRPPKWFLVKQIHNGAMDKEELYYWNVVAYNGKCLVLSGCTRYLDRVVHVYHLSANKWVAMGSVPGWCDANQDFFQFTRSVSSVVGLDEILPCDDRRISALSPIMALVDGRSSEQVEKQLRKRSAEHSILYKQSANKKKKSCLNKYFVPK